MLNEGGLPNFFGENKMYTDKNNIYQEDIIFKVVESDTDLTISLINRGRVEDCGLRAMEDFRERFPDPEFTSDEVMIKFFSRFIEVTDWEWIDAEEIAALTDAPILGYRDENGNIVKAYGFMDYAVESLMWRLYTNNFVVLQKG